MRSRRGMSLLSVLTAASIIAVIMAALIKFLSVGFKSTARITQRVDLNAVKDSIVKNLSCTNTLGAAIPPGGCAPTNYLPLMDKRNKPMTAPLQAAGSGPFAGSGKIGEWWVRAYCDSAANTLVIEVAKVGGKGGFAEDPVLKQTLDWANKSLNPLFGSPPAVPLCVERFVPTIDTCPAGEFATKVDFDTRTVTCATPPAPPLPTLVSRTVTAPTTQLAVWGGGAETWGSTATCAANEALMGGGGNFGAANSAFGRYDQISGNGWSCGVNIASCTAGSLGAGGNGCNSYCFALCGHVQ